MSSVDPTSYYDDQTTNATFDVTPFKSLREINSTAIKFLRHQSHLPRLLPRYPSLEDGFGFEPFRASSSAQTMIGDAMILQNLSCTPTTSFPSDNISVLSDCSLGNGTFPPLENDTNTILPPLELWQTVAVAIFCSLSIVLTVCGNILVILSFIVERAIRQPSNYFIASLAVTDLLIGSVSMPFYTVYVLMQKWTLGPVLCDLWLSVDYTVCLVSQYTVLLITIDRFCSVKIAARYRNWRTRRKVLVMVAVTWIIPAMLFFTSIFGWEHFVGYRALKEHECAVQFLRDPVFNTALIVTYYWVTLVVLIILYAGIYKTAYDMHKKSEAKHRKMQTLVALSAGGMAGMAGRTAGFGMAKPPGPSDDNPLMIAVMAHQVNRKTEDGEKQQKESSSCQGSTGLSSSSENKTGDEIFSMCLKKDAERSDRSSSPTFESDEDSSSQLAAPPPKANNTKDSKDAQAPARRTNIIADALPKIPEQTILDTTTKTNANAPPPVPPRNFSGKKSAGKIATTPTSSEPISPVGDIPMQKLGDHEASRIIRTDDVAGKSPACIPKSLPLSDVVAIVPIASSTPTDLSCPVVSSWSESSSAGKVEGPKNSASAPVSLTSSCLNLAHPVAYDVLTGLDSGTFNSVDRSSVLSSVSGGPSVQLTAAQVAPKSPSVSEISVESKKSLAPCKDNDNTATNAVEKSNSFDSLCRNVSGISNGNNKPVEIHRNNRCDSLDHKQTSKSSSELCPNPNPHSNSLPVTPTPVTSTPILSSARCFLKRTNKIHFNSEDEDLDLSLDDGDETDELGGRESSEHSTDVVVTSIIHTCTAVTKIGDGESPNSQIKLPPLVHPQTGRRKSGSIHTGRLSVDSGRCNANSNVSAAGQQLKADHNSSSKLNSENLESIDTKGSGSRISSALNQLITTHNVHSNKTKTSVARAESSSVGENDRSSVVVAPGTSDTQCSLRSSLKNSKKSIAKSIRSLKKKKKKKDAAAHVRHRSKSENRANKALRTISVILGCFVACWTPYHIIAIAESWCTCTNIHLFLFSYFLCYANSPLNPFCYALANHQFKKTFIRILNGDLHYT
ncbi:uncharacterized protein LOC125178173 [Hyalella azteca]|uniref:Uncharacterized protein LOC125178173 n=1 Tax=Hyalella azteca TaxID=294128 RepID=A0A979FL74_HYAAZ|nr:uncharacterized protein LOC125178173 [Hyalella azteca]